MLCRDVPFRIPDLEFQHPRDKARKERVFGTCVITTEAGTMAACETLRWTRVRFRSNCFALVEMWQGQCGHSSSNLRDGKANMVLLFQGTGKLDWNHQKNTETLKLRQVLRENTNSIVTIPRILMHFSEYGFSGFELHV